MNGRIETDLARWLPQLIQSWRKRAGHGAHSPAEGLTPPEIRKVTEGVRILSAGYTGARRIAGTEYLENPALLGAYLLYYWPISYVEARACLATAGISGRNALDLGSGPGPAACALADCGFESLTIADHSPKALDLASGLLHGRSLKAFPWDAEGGSPLPGSGYDCIVMGNVLNELWPHSGDWAERRSGLVSAAMGALVPGGVLCIYEPALKPVTRQLLQLRDMAAARGFSILAPCFIQDRCPAFALPDGTCHTAHRWTPPAYLRDLIRRNDTVKDEVAFSYLILARGGEKTDPDPRSYRIVSDPLINKAGRTRLILCGKGGRFSLSAKKGEGGSAERIFFSLKRGDSILLDGALPRGEGLALGPDTTITLRS